MKTHNRSCFVALACLMAVPAFSQTVTATIPAGRNPVEIAVNPSLNKVYVLDFISNTVTIVNTLTSTSVNVPVGSGPYKLAVNEVTGRVYVGNQYSGNVSVIDGYSDTVIATITARGSGLVGIAVNPATNVIAASNEFDNSATFMDGNTNTVIGTITVPFPEQVTVNPLTNLWYFANENADTVTVVDGSKPIGSAGGSGSGGGGTCGAPGTSNPQIGLTPSNYYPPAGAQFTLNITMLGANCGIVTFTDGGTVLGTAGVNARGQASFTHAIHSGSHSFVAKFGGAPGFAPATSNTVWIHD